MLTCEEKLKVFCILGAVVKNNLCDIDVIGNGLKKWLVGEQDKPWSNYYFIPQLPKEDEGTEEYLKNHPNIKKRMQKLKEYNLLEEVDYDK